MSEAPLGRSTYYRMIEQEALALFNALSEAQQAEIIRLMASFRASRQPQVPSAQGSADDTDE